MRRAFLRRLAARPLSRADVALLGVLLAGVLLAACGSGGDDTPGPSEPEAGGPPSGAPDPARALGVPGLSVYSLGGDLQLEQDGALRTLLVAPDLSVSYLSPRISPDGTQVAYAQFTTASGRVRSEILMSPLSGGEGEIVRQAGEEAGEFFWTPQWSPDGGALVYAHQRNVPDEEGRAFQIDVERVDLASGEVELLVENAQEPALSPEGRLLVFVDDPAIDHKLSLLELETGERTLLLDEGDGLTVFRLPQFSPNGAWIAVLASGDGPQVSSRPAAAALRNRNGVQDIWLLRPDGSGLQRLTDVREDQPDFAWSSDSRQILLRGTFGVYLTEVATRTTRTILVPGEFHGTHDWRGALPAEAGAPE